MSSTQKVCRCPAAGYGAPNCTTECGGGAANTCNTRGECIYATGQCNCEQGWIGKGCSYDCPTAGGIVCSNVSTCTLNAAGTAAVCNCPSNRRGPACEIECIGGAAGPCSGHGQCQDDGQCLCDASYRGQACDVPCPGLMGYADRIVCSDHGTCTLSAQCQCDAQWRGRDCSVCTHKRARKHARLNANDTAPWSHAHEHKQRISSPRTPSRLYVTGF